jgi:alkylhydroperoxidase/carboxymuconolactone decarboxylase family protein YurZ
MNSRRDAPDVKAVLAREEAFALKFGSDAAAYSWLAERDPGYEDGRLNLAERVYAPDNPALALKYHAMIAAVLCARSRLPGTRHHIRRALDAGASVDELLEAFETMAFVVGFPALHFALDHLKELAEERNI